MNEENKAFLMSIMPFLPDFELRGEKVINRLHPNASLFFSVWHYNAKARIGIKIDGQYYSKAIHVTKTRHPEAIARDIRNRLLKSLPDMLAKAEIEDKELLVRTTKRERMKQELYRAFGTGHYTGHQHEYFRLSEGLEAKVELSRIYGDTMSISFDVSSDIVVPFFNLISSFAQSIPR